MLQQTNTNIDPGDTVVWDNYNNASSFNTKYFWAAHIFDGSSWTNETYYFSTRARFIPPPPTDFNTTANSRSRISLTWTNQPGNNTYIEYNTIESWEPTEGIEIVNDSFINLSSE